MGEPIKSFEQLRSWQASMDFAVEVYKITKKFPISEQYGITNQLRRASSGISANIAEGFGRTSSKDKRHFYQIAYGSLLETRSFLYLAERLEYINDQQLEILLGQADSIQKMINASRRALRE